MRAAHSALQLARARLAEACLTLDREPSDAQRGRVRPAAALARRQHYEARLRERRAAAEAQVRAAEQALAAAQAELTEAGRERLAAEKLVSVRAAQARHRESADQQREIDDHGRGRRRTGG